MTEHVNSDEKDVYEKFVYNGVFYSCIEDFIRAERAFLDSQVTPETFRKMWHDMGENVGVNIFFTHWDEALTNSDVQAALSDSLKEVVEALGAKVWGKTRGDGRFKEEK